MKFRIFSLVHHTHSAAAELLDDAVVRDGLADHTQECYGGSMPKSMKAEELAIISRSCWRKIAIPLKIPAHVRRNGASL